MTGTHDPGVSPESEGIPDLQDGTPQQQRASDPQQEPVPGDEPAAVESFGTTPAEQREGEPLDDRLAAEEPEVAGEPAGIPDEETGQLSDDPHPDRPANQDVFSREGETDGMSAEEAAVHVPEDQDGLGFTDR